MEQLTTQFFPNLDNLDVSKPEMFKQWLDRLEVLIANRISEANLLKNKGEKLLPSSEEANLFKYNQLCTALGPDGCEILKNVQNEMPDDKKNNYCEVTAGLKQYFEPKKNVFYQRRIFMSRMQQNDESIFTYVDSVRKLAQHIEVKDKEDKDIWILSVIVNGLQDRKMSERLQLMEGLTLERAVSTLVATEAVQRQDREMHQSERANGSVEQVKGRGRGGFRGQRGSRGYRNSFKDQSDHKEKNRCHKCGYSHDQNRCPAEGKRCNYCHRVGHFAVVCRQKQDKRKRRVNPVDDYSDMNDDFYYESSENELSETLNEVSINNVEQNRDWRMSAQVSGQNGGEKVIDFRIDTGAAVSCMPLKMFTNKWGQLREPKLKLLAAGENSLKTRGVLKLNLEYKNRKVTENFYVVENLKTPLLGVPAIDKLNIVARINKCEESSLETPNSYWKEKFPKLFTGLGKMNTTYSIKLREEAQPFSVSTPRRVPFQLMEPVKRELEKMEKSGIIEKISKPTPWCAPLVVVPKANNAVRLVGDFVELNKDIVREKFQLPTVEETLTKIGEASFFSKLDANSGFYQIKMDSKSTEYTCFSTPFGRYVYKRLPMGISSAPEVFMREMSQILEGLPGVACMMDDVVVFAKTKKEHDSRLENTLKKLSSAGVTLNPDKCVFEKKSIKYLGHIVSAEGIKADPAKIKAIQDFPSPKNVTGVRQFLGMVNQLAKFVPNIAEMTKPIRELLHKNNLWSWTEVQETAFNSLKKILTSDKVLVPYDPNKKSMLAVDACNYGLGAAIFQETVKGWQPVAYASKSLTDTERRYAIIEKEALAVTYGCEKFAQYLIGRKFEIQTDHRPLLACLQTKRLDQLTPRLQRLKLRLSRFDYHITYVPGKEHYVPDAMSRAPVEKVCTFMADKLQIYEAFCVKNMPVSANLMERVIQEQKSDPVLTRLREFCTENDVHDVKKKDFPPEIRHFMSIFNEISISEDVLLRGTRIIVPKSMQKEMLVKIHKGHQGLVKCQRLAGSAIWWPEINKHIEDAITSCATCAKFQARRAEPMIASDVPRYPWQKIGADFFQYNNSTYLLFVDYLSRWIEFVQMKTTSGTSTVVQFKSICSKYGIPEEIRTDNGPQFSSHEFARFCQEYGIKHTTSSPLYPQSNGTSERAVRTLKNIMRKCIDSDEDIYLGLLNYRSTPLEGGLSPAEILLGRRPRSIVPQIRKELEKRVPCLQQFREKDKQVKDRMKKNYDNRRGARTKPSCEVGDEVFLPGERVKGKIIARRPEPRSFDIDTPSGVIRRNNAQFNKLPRYKFKAQFQHPCMLPGMSTTDKQVKPGPLSGVVSPASIPERRRPEPRKSVQKPRPHDETKSSRASSFNRMLQGFLGSSPP